MSEAALVKAIQIEASRMGARLFRNQTGLGFTRGSASRLERDGTYTVFGARPIRFGLCVGGSDLIGFTRSGLFLATEVKTPTGRATVEQKAFIDTVNSFGGIGIFARSVADLKGALGG